jgi:hypothetical protein
VHNRKNEGILQFCFYAFEMAFTTPALLMNIHSKYSILKLCGRIALMQLGLIAQALLTMDMD